MNQSERRNYLIQKLLEEQPQYAKMQIPGRCEEQKTLLRALMNVRMPGNFRRNFCRSRMPILQRKMPEEVL